MNPRTLLLVDDNPVDRDVVRHRLARSYPGGLTILEADTGEEALRICHETPPDCVLLDFNLPDMDGLEFIELLADAEGRCPVPVIILTGKGSETLAVSALKRDVQDYLVKGKITPAGLQRAIENAIERFATARQLEAQRFALQVRNHQLETYASMVAHDLRNPLDAILMSAGLLLERRPPGEDDSIERRQLELIRRSVQRANRLIEDLLDVARLEAGRLALEIGTEAVESLIREAIEPFCIRAEAEGLDLRTEADGDFPQVAIDRERIFQVLANLIGNAIKFTPRGGTITVRAELDGDGVRISVSDTGPGIAPDHLPHLWDRFWQSHGADRRGAGLGLTIAKGIVDAHGGTIGVKSRIGEGTTFFFTVPVLDPGTGP